LILKLAAGAIVLAALYFLLLGGEYTFLDLWRIDRAHQAEMVELERLRDDVATLQVRADSLASDSATLERIARENYGLIREGERLYRFVEPDTGAASGSTSTSPSTSTSTSTSGG
jgi:cell division protein FtsB